jgi:hypothetical protein
MKPFRSKSKRRVGSESGKCLRVEHHIYLQTVVSVSKHYKDLLKGILKLILVIFCISWKLAIGSINDIYITLTQFLSMKSKWHNLLIILSYLAVFPIIEFLLPGQKFISTLFSDILTILGIIWACKVFLDCFYN